MVSLDTASTKSGWSYWENGKLIDYGVIDYSKEEDAEIRLEDMCIALVEILNKYKPQIVAIEMTVVERNAHTQRTLSEIVGVVRGWVLCNYAEITCLRPSEWRKLVCNQDEKAPMKRAECKEWSKNKVKQLYQIDGGDDQSDSILIGLARINLIEKAKAV